MIERDNISYKREFYQRLPRGQIWPQASEDGSVWDGLLDVLGMEPARVWASAVGWLTDFFPDTCTDQLADWERILSLPDCGLAVGTTAERRGAIIARLRRHGDPTLANIQALADSFDNGAAITTGGTSSLFYFDNVTEWDGVNEIAAAGAAYEVLITYTGPQSDLFECTMRHAIPIHLSITFTVV